MTTVMGIYLIKLAVKKLGYKGAAALALLPVILIAVCLSCLF